MTSIHSDERSQRAWSPRCFDSATAQAGEHRPDELQMWRSAGLLQSTTRWWVTDESRLVLERLADTWALDRAGRTLRFYLRTDPSASRAD